MAVDVAYIVSHGFAARMVTQTNLLGLLRKEGKTVALICPDKNDPNLKRYCATNDITIVEFNAHRGFGDENYMFKRKYFLEDIESNPALMDKHIHTTRYNTSIHPIRKIRPYYYWIVYKLIPRFPSIRKRFIASEKKNLFSLEAKRLMAALQPAKLVSTYPVNFTEAVLLHYGNLDPKVETWIHLLSWDNITCKGRFAALADKYVAWGNIMKQELQEYYGIMGDSIFTCGVPHFDLHKTVKKNPNAAPFLEQLGLDAERPYLFFAMSSPRFAPHEIDIVEWLATNVKAGRFGDTQLIIRPHPQNVQGNMADKRWLPRLEALPQRGRIAVDLPNLAPSKLRWSMEESDMTRFAQLITGSSVVINSGSTVSIDGLMHDKPVVLTSFDGDFEIDYWKSARRLIDYPHLKKLVDTGGVVVTRSYSDLETVLKATLSKNGIDFSKIRFARDEECFPSESSTTLVVKCLLNGRSN